MTSIYITVMYFSEISLLFIFKFLRGFIGIIFSISFVAGKRKQTKSYTAKSKKCLSDSCTSNRHCEIPRFTKQRPWSQCLDTCVAGTWKPQTWQVDCPWTGTTCVYTYQLSKSNGWHYFGTMSFQALFILCFVVLRQVFDVIWRYIFVVW